MSDTITTTELSKSFVYLVSPMGGDNYWARVLNGCDKVYLDTEGTLSVSLAPNGRYILTCHNPFFDKCSVPMRKLGLIHEAGHLALRHIERFTRIITQQTDPVVKAALITMYNWAMDFAVNDAIVSKEKEFARVHQPKGSTQGEWHFLMPQEYGFPAGKSMETYLHLLVKDLPRIYKQVMEQLEQMEEAGADDSSDQDDGNEPGEGESQGDDGDEGTEEGGQPGTGSNGKPSTKGRKGRGGQGRSDDEDPTLPQGFIGKAKDNPEMFDKLQEFFDRVNHENHKAWNNLAKKMTTEEAISAANKMKQHARQLVKSAHEQTKRTRGTIPAGIEELVRKLLEPEQVPWNWLFKDIVAGAINSKVIEEMVSPNMSMLNLDYLEPWPGNTLDFAFNVVFFTDTSGSMSNPEYARAVNEVNAILNSNRSVKLTYIEGDAAIQKEMEVSNIAIPDEEDLAKISKRKGYGGTVYTPVFRRVCGVDTPNDWQNPADRPENPIPRPDLMIVYTDGGVCIEGEVFPQYRPPCPIIWLVAPGCHAVPGMDDTSPDRVIQMFEIKSEDF